MFKLLNTSGSGHLSKDEFLGIYDACLYSWNVSKVESEWFADLPGPVRAFCAGVRSLIRHPWFEYGVCE